MRPLSHERRVLLGALFAGLPGTVLGLVLLLTGDFTANTKTTLSVLVVLLWLGFAFAVQGRVTRPLQTASNLLSALREGDYSIRARGARNEDALGELFFEVNALAQVFQRQRMGALEAAALLSAVMAEIDVAVFTFDEEGELKLINRAGERLLAQPSERLLGKRADELGLANVLSARESVIDAAFPGGAGRFGVRRTRFRQEGRVHQLAVVSDLSKPLREEERQAWQRLIRVMGHELNNSLAPIKSIAGSLERLATRDDKPDDWQEDLRHGLQVITSRSDALQRFLSAYSRLARLPSPTPRAVDAGALIRRVAALETRLPVEVKGGPAITLSADPDQLEQLLINLVKNAADAALETKGRVSIGWSASPSDLQIAIEDEGPGLPEPGNLFVPFFTTKPGGSGIGLVLSRQIAEAHGGSVRLVRRTDRTGARAVVYLPLGTSAAA